MNGCERNARYVNGIIEVMVGHDVPFFVRLCLWLHQCDARKIDKNTTRHRCDPGQDIIYLEMVDSTMNIGDNYFYIGIDWHRR